MNLVEVLVAGSIVLGSATGSLGIWARIAHSSRDAEALLLQQRQADEQLLAVQARLQALAAERRTGSQPVPETCPGVEQLGLPSSAELDDPAAAPLPVITPDASGQILTARVQAGEGHSRTRMFDLVTYGLCAGVS